MSRNPSSRSTALLVGLNVMLMASLAISLFDRQGSSPSILSPAEAQAASSPSKATSRVDLTEAARRASPGVVSIGSNQTGYFVNPFSGFLSDYVIYPYKEKIPYLGSGVIISGDGLVVTNFHVVENAQEVFVTLPDGRELPGKVLDADTLLDIALIKIQGPNLPTARLGDSSSLQVGEWVLAMGNPFGNLIGDPTPTVTAGVISAMKRTFRPGGNVQRAYYDMIQTDAAINPGNSGGALVNSSGEVIGINTFIMSRSGGAEGIGFAIPINRVKAVVEEILLHGRIRSRLMDFQVQNLVPNVARMLGTQAQQGAVIVDLVSGSQAYKAGLRINDVITAVNGRRIKDAQEFNIVVWTQSVGTAFKLDVDRGGKQMQIDYELQEAKGR